MLYQPFSSCLCSSFIAASIPFCAVTSFPLSSVFFEATHFSLLLSLRLFLTTWWLPCPPYISSPVLLRLHTSHPYLLLPPSTDFNYCFLPEAVSLSLLTLLYNASRCLFFFFHVFCPDWILPAALPHLYNKANILGCTLSSKQPYHQISSSFVDLITFPSHLKNNYKTTTLCTHIIAPLWGLPHRLRNRYTKKRATIQVCKKTAFKLHGHLSVTFHWAGVIKWCADSVSTRSNLCKYRMQVHPKEIRLLQQLLCLSMRVIV